MIFVEERAGGFSAAVTILNSVGSVGKTSTARALQKITRKPFLHVSMDAFVDMLPESMFGHPDGLVFETLHEQGVPSVAITTGAVMLRAMCGMRHAIAAMAAQGNDIIVDEVMMDAAEADEYWSLLVQTSLRFVGLIASLEVLEARERGRGDRQPGLARWQFSRVHQGQSYDLEIETSGSTPEQNAHRIRAAFDL